MFNNRVFPHHRVKVLLFLRASSQPRPPTSRPRVCLIFNDVPLVSLDFQWFPWFSLGFDFNCIDIPLVLAWCWMIFLRYLVSQGSIFPPSAKNSPPRRPWSSGILLPVHNFARSPNLQSKMSKTNLIILSLENWYFYVFKTLAVVQCLKGFQLFKFTFSGFPCQVKPTESIRTGYVCALRVVFLPIRRVLRFLSNLFSIQNIFWGDLRVNRL